MAFYSFLFQHVHVFMWERAKLLSLFRLPADLHKCFGSSLIKLSIFYNVVLQEMTKSKILLRTLTKWMSC